ncbi:isopentenyl phosphate kinase [Methanobrevibacter filiformis]|uniref:Isopentenyl phosphate kinase n=1 Tax=Methanobrevibacter filiformis TaxID=55758 RepID=A0A166AWT5_9EURY|nr:isopentenyl phosphate kinase [Methanobrevibacter filiformis]KZX12568.1 acetylglutamate kinase [Methanobrevibacter filiformis]
MIILKLGGSVITKKDSINPEVNYINLNRLASEIKSYLDGLNNSENNISNLNNHNNLIIVHGAGSFGHPSAKKYGIGLEFDENQYPEKKIGFSITHNDVSKLNNIVSKALINEGVPVIPIPISSCVITKNKRILSFNLNLLKKYSEEGFVPVLYGDVTLDTEIKLAVVSGDQIINYIASKLNPGKIILGTDVDGVFNKNPKQYDDGILIESVSSLDDLDQFDLTTNIDVTGGMIGKIKELLLLAEEGIESKIVNASIPGLILDSLNNKNVKGTMIKK